VLSRSKESSELEWVAERECHLVIDSGFSFTTGVPFFNQMAMKQATQRIDVGGKMLTNLLGEIVS
jgi:actin-related protein 6